MEIIIKLDHDEPVKVKTSSIYGEMPRFPDLDKITDEFWNKNYIGKLKEKIDRLKMDLQNKDDEIQDLKLENDRLKKRDEIMTHFLRSVRCKGVFCDKCDLYSEEEGCYWINEPSCKKMWNMIDDVLKKLEDL